MRQISRHRSRMGKQGDASARQRTAEFGFGKQAVDAEVQGGGHGVKLVKVNRAGAG
jgi:hypothetical protein